MAERPLMKSKKKVLTLRAIRGKKTVRSRISILNVFRQILDGIRFIHSKGFQHRDLKPGNIVLNNEFEVKICDFGIAHDLNSMTITQNRNAATLRYLSPEGKKEFMSGVPKRYDSSEMKRRWFEARDMFAFGMMLLEALCTKEEVTEEIPELLSEFIFFDASSKEDHRDKNLKKEVNLILWKNHFGIDKVKEVEILQKLLHPDPEKRMTSEEALEDEFFSSHISMLVSEESFDLDNLIREKNIEVVNRKISKALEDHKDSYDDDIYVRLDRKNDRKNLLMKSLNQIVGIQTGKTTLKSILSKIRCHFEDESGIDQGGLTRELFSEILSEVTLKFCDKIGCASSKTDSSQTFYAPTDLCDKEDLFFLLGRLCCRCLLEKRLFKISFGPFIYSYLLNQSPRTKEDWIRYCKYYDGDGYLKNIEKYLFNPLNFSQLVESEETFTKRFYTPMGGSQEDFEVLLKETNKEEYLLWGIKQKLRGENGFREKNLNGFRRGFFSLMPEDLSMEIRYLLNPFELEKILYGDSSITAEIVLKNLSFKWLSSSNDDDDDDKLKSYIVKYLKDLEERSKEEEEHNEEVPTLIDFVRFITGGCEFVNGVLMKDGKPQKISIKKHNTRDYLLSHTCSFELDVGRNFESDDYEKLKKRFDFNLVSYKKNEMTD